MKRERERQRKINCREWKSKSRMRKNQDSQTPAEAAVSVLASCQGTGGRVCYSSVAVICLREVQSKLVQTAQPGSASWVNTQPRRGLHTTDSPWPPLQSVLCWNPDPFYNLKAQWCVCVCAAVKAELCLAKKTLFHTNVKKSFACMMLVLKQVIVYSLHEFCFILCLSCSES